MLREWTNALTLTLPNSVTEAFGIFSVSSRNRAGQGFHSTREPFTWYTTAVPLSWDRPFRSVPARWRHAGAARIPGQHDLVERPQNRHDYYASADPLLAGASSVVTRYSIDFFEPCINGPDALVWTNNMDQFADLSDGGGGRAVLCA